MTGTSFAAMVAALTSPALAWSDFENYKTAARLVGSLSLEGPCGRTDDHAAIARVIDERAEPASLEFDGVLAAMPAGFEMRLGETSESATAVHCRNAGNSARAYGFID